MWSLRAPKKSEEERRRENVFGSITGVCFSLFVSQSVHAHEPQRPLKAFIYLGIALAFALRAWYYMRKKPSDPQALPGQVAEIEAKAAKARWPMTVLAVFFCGGSLYALLEHRPQDAAIAGIFGLINATYGIYGWRIQRRRQTWSRSL